MNNSESHSKMMSFLVEVLDEREKLIKNKPTGGI
jgi:hypothetical protein